MRFMIPAPALAMLCAATVHAETATSRIPIFAEETATSGLTSTYTGEWQYMVGGGVAAFDCNTDGRADMLIAGGTSPATFYRNTSAIAGPLTFAPEPSGLEMDAVTGAYPLDIDSDTITDLVLLRVGENMVMRGLGGCRFAPANADWSFDGGDAWSTAMAAIWEKGAAWPTIAIGNYVNRKEEAFPWGSCTENWLHRPGDAGFAPPLPLKPSFCALSMLFTDWNRSGTPSLRVSNDREYYKGGQEQLWHVKPGEAPALYTADEGWKPLKIWGMGIASHDLTGDGYPEYFLTSMADNKLQTLADVPEGGTPKPTFADVAFAKGVTAHRPYIGDDLNPSTAWHAQFEDMNNDGLTDLFVAKGNVAKMPDFAANDPDNLLLQAEGGKFIEAGNTSGTGSLASGRGAAIADFNMDGWLDLVVVNQGTPAQIWRNTGAGLGHWVGLRITQPAPNTDAIGAWVELRRGDAITRREITVGGGHASGQIGWVHFGLGDATTADFRVIWPDGSTSDWLPVGADAFYTFARGEAPKLWVAP